MSTKDPRTKGRAVGQAIVLLFDKMSIHNEAAVDTAVAELDHLLPDPSMDMNEVVEAIDSVQHLLEFILCVSSDYGFELLSSGILKLRPNTPEEFHSSTLYKILAQFSVSLYLPYQRVSDAPPELVTNRRSVELAFSVLQAITLLNASDTLAEETVDVSGTRWAAKNKEKQEKRRKRSIHTGRVPAIDVKAIVEYGAQVPTSKPQAAELAATVIAEQISVLRDFFSIFRKEETIAFFKGVYLPLPPLLAVAFPSQRTDRATSAVSPIIPLPSASQGAFPLVQPMKAALYFDNAEGFGPWRVKMSGRAERDLRQWRKRDAVMFDIIVGKIKVLSNGNFTDDNYKQLVSHGGEVEVPIYEAKMTKNTRLLYQIHCDIDFEDNVERQVIRVFGVYKHDEINAQFWNTMSRQLNCRGAEYKNRCTFRNKASYQRGEYTVLPAEFPVRSSSEEEVVASPSTDSAGLTKEDMESLHALLTLEKFVTFSQAFLNTILAEQDVSHVFDVSHREKEIIEHDSSCFVIGRSGTGKTTTMVFKILGIERTYDTGSFRGAMAKPRQVFVTQSQVLAKKVDEYYAKLHQSHATAHLSPSQLTDMASKNRARRDRMVDEDEEIIYTSSLPRRYGALDDSHFPLFLTFSHLCRLLEGEFRYLVEQEKVDANKASRLRDIMKLRPRSTRSQTVGYLQDDKDSFLDYDKFREVYWKHFPENPLNPDLVWGEFMAVIKGSEGAMKSDTGYLDKETYVGLGHRGTQTSSPAQREDVYKLFEVYMRRKRLHGHYDPADRTRMLIRSLKVTRVPGKAVDFLYVDEVQDNFLIDSLVLKAICSNPHGLFWAGDTAQTIAAGSSFKFKDLKTLLYRTEEASVWAKRARPETFYLTTNYRSHAGIVNCADSIVQLITEYWPDTIDPLPQEKGTSPGSKPVFFSDQDAARLQRLLFRDSSGSGAIEFGARQCILVRDRAARERLKAEFGKIGQVLTVYESKGLEFDDVLLYNFFEDSTVSYSQWGVLLNSVPGCMAPAFDDGRHSGVCRELKNLYVAITRARQNLWITDCSENAYPLKRIWAERGLVEEHAPGAPLPTLAVTSGKEEWDEAARLLFVKRQYSEAVDAFERADRPQERLVALAYSLREQARASPANARGKELSQPAAFTRAADAFVDAVPGAQELEDRRTYYRIAAECYIRSGNDGKAGVAYREAGQYTLAAKHFRKAGMFDEAVAVVQSHGQEVAPDVAQSIINVSKLYYIKENELGKAKALFQDDDDALQEYMDDRDLNGPRASLHEQNGQYDEAAECHLREGNDLKAIELFLLSNSTQSLERAGSCILDGFWLYLSLGAPEDNWSDQMVIMLAVHAEDLQHRLSDDDLRNEMAMFRAISENDIPALMNLGQLFYRQDNLPAALLCLDRVFPHDFRLESASLSEVVECFRTFLIYARVLQRFSCVQDPCANRHIRRLFAFRKVNEDNEELFLLPKGCYLYTRVCSSSSALIEDSAKGLNIARWDLERLIKMELRQRLKDRVWNQNEICHTLPYLRPCLLFAASGFCPRRECPQLHIPKESPAEAGTTYNQLVRVHVLQIMIFHTLYATEIEYHELVQQQRAWLRRLYEALYPKYHAIGSLHVLSLELVPELIRGRHIIAVWIQDFVNRLDPNRGGVVHAFLVNLMRTIRLAMLFDRRVASGSLERIPCAIRFPNKRPQHFRRFGGAYIIHDLLAATQCYHPAALDRGVLFLNHVLYNRLRVDIGVLCDFMDHLCGAMLISLYLKAKGTLDCLTMPKSWLVRLLQDVDQLASMRTERWSKYVACMGRLLGDVYTGNNAGHLLFENLDFSKPGLNRTRVIFFIRICRNIYFWGYNLRVQELRYEIHKIISGMKDLNRGIASPLSSAYIYAKDWEALGRTALNSMADSTLDEVIQLSHASGAKPKNVLADVRRVVYSNTEDILALLGATHIPKLSSIPNDRDPKTSDTTMTSSSASENRVDNSYEGRAIEAQVLETEDEQETDPPRVEFTDQQMIAASQIISVYRKYARRKAAVKDPLREMRHRIFRDFLANSRTIPWQSSSYRFLFLGAVPHLFTVTEMVKDHLYRAKSAAKESLRNAHDAELESVQAALDDASRLFKEACRLHKALAPSATVHKIRDVNGLQQLAVAVESLAEQVEDAIQQDQSFLWTVDLQLFKQIRDSDVFVRARQM